MLLRLLDTDVKYIPKPRKTQFIYKQDKISNLKLFLNFKYTAALGFK